MALPAIRPIRTTGELAGLHGGKAIAPLRPEVLVAHKPDLHFAAIQPDGTLAGRCSIWIGSVPSPEGPTAGVIGHFACCDPPTGQALLTTACDELFRRDCGVAIGPMDGNTWRSYRHVTDRGVEPPFFLEPANPAYFPLAFSNAGFSPLAQYYSALATELTYCDPRMEAVRQRLATAGVSIRTLDPTRFEEEAGRIYELSLVAFAHNFLYTPIDREEFLAQYAAVRAVLRPELCLLAEYQGRLVAFLFALPDMCQRERGQAIDTVILKTVAVLPGRDGAGLGSYLVEQTHHRAHNLGYRRAIHALMHESNKSRNLSAHYAQTMRRYTLFMKRLAQGSAA